MKQATMELCVGCAQTRAGHPCTPVGLTDIAARLQVPPRTVYTWRQREKLPPVRWAVSGDPAWCWEHDIKPWDDAGRIQRVPWRRPGSPGARSGCRPAPPDA